MWFLLLNFLFLSCFFPWSEAHATEEIIYMWKSIRSHALGNTFVTDGNYSDALFGNPARHTEVSAAKFSFIDLNLETNNNLFTSVDDIKRIKGSGSDAITSVSPFIGLNQHARLGLLIAGYHPEAIGDYTGIAGGFLINTQLNLMPHFDTNIDSQTYIDLGPHFGLSHKFLEETLSLGFNLHVNYRIAVEERINPTGLLSNSKALRLKAVGTEGLGADVDLGAFYKVPLEFRFVRFSAGASLNNLFMSTYTLANQQYVTQTNLQHPPRNNRTLSLGLREDFPDFWFFKDVFTTIEFTDIGSLIYRSTTAKRVHLGAEGRFLKYFFLRGGVNQGYFTGGLGFDLPLIKIDLATWGEELGASAGIQEDRRFGLRLALEI